MNLHPFRCVSRSSRRRVALLAILALAPTSPGPSADSCVKRVFNAYCLGGDASTLPEPVASGPPLRFDHDGKTVTVTVEDRRIVSVSRQEPPGSWINYVEWRQKLDRLYGRGVDRSDFPAYASSRSSRLNAIIAGKGKAHMQWSQPGWRVAVIWDQPDHVTLRYELTGDTEDPASSSEGL